MKLVTYGIVFLLVAFNLLSLYSNLKRQHQVDQLTRRLETAETDKAWGGVDALAKVTHPEIALLNNGISLLVFFTDKSCSSCLVYEVAHLNDFYGQHGAHTQIYYVSHKQPNLANYRAEFPFRHISPEQPLLDVEFELANTVAFVVDGSGTVQQIYRAEVANQKKSRLFYEKVRSLFASSTGP